MAGKVTNLMQAELGQAVLNVGETVWVAWLMMLKNRVSRECLVSRGVGGIFVAPDRPDH